MLNHFAPIAVCILLILMGLYQINKRMKKLNEKRSRIEDFLNDLKLFVESGARNREAYFRMVHKSALIQTDIGPYGIVSYKPPGAGYVINNYQLVVNILPEIDLWIRDNDMFLTIEPGRSLVQTLQEVLVRFLGVIDNIQPQIEKIKRNPFLLLREGTSWLLSLPFGILSFVGIRGENIIETVSQSGFVRFLSGIFSIIGLLASVVTLVTGWSRFIEIVTKWF